MDKSKKELWENIQREGMPLITSKIPPKFFIDDFWGMDKLQTRVIVTARKKAVAKMSFAHAILNNLIFSVLEEEGVLPNYNKDTIQSFIFSGSGNIESVEKYCTMVLDYLFDSGSTMFETTPVIGKLKEAFVQFAWIIDNKRLMDISIIDIFELCDADETIKDWILHGPIKRGGMSLEEVETLKAHTLKYISEVIEKKNIQPLKSLLAAGTGLRLAQFIDCLFMIGTRPDGDVVIPNIEPESWLRGISTLDSFFYESKITRDSTIITKLDIKDPGSFQKFVSYLNNPNFLNKDPDYMCDSIHYVTYMISSQKELDKIHDRYMIIGDDPTNVRRVDSKVDTNLIGQVVKLRSPKTCNSKDGLCRYCVGENTYFDNVSGPLESTANLGVMLVKIYISPKGQDFLSSKHNMVTIIGHCEFYHNDKITIVVRSVDIVYVEDGEIIIPQLAEGETFFRTFSVNHKGTIYEVECNTNLFVGEDGNIHVQYVNKRKSKAYINIKDIFSRPNSFEDPIRELNNILDSPYVVGELLMNRMIFRVTPDKTKVRPDYSEPFNEDELVFSNLKTSIMNNVGVVNKLPYGDFNSIMSDPDNYKPVPKMNYDVLFRDRSDYEKTKTEYVEKYKDKM